MDATTEIQLAEQQMQIAKAQADAQFALTPMGQTLKQFETMQRMGQMFATSSIVPTAYQGNVANCAIACDMAHRMQVTPMAVMQNLYIVHGMPAWSSKFLISCINNCGRFTPIKFEFQHTDDPNNPLYGCRCVAYEKQDTDKEHPLEGTWVTWQMVKAEGWDSKSGSKWKTMPEQMFRYRAAAFWQRTYAPEISMGMLTQEEAREVVDAEYEEIPMSPRASKAQVRSTAAALAAEAAAKAAIKEAEEAPVVVEEPEHADGELPLED